MTGEGAVRPNLPHAVRREQAAGLRAGSGRRKRRMRLHRARGGRRCPRGQRIPHGGPPMTDRIRHFLAGRRFDEPCLVVDLEIVRDNYAAFARALPDTRVFYAVKANPAPELLKLLAGLGSCFDTASLADIEMVLAAGATPD